MKAKFVYVMAAGLAVGMISTISQKAMADDYYAVLSPCATMVERPDHVTRIVEKTLSYPVVIERAGITSTTVLGTSLMPVILEKTTVVRPPHFLSFGVWP